MSEQYVCSLSAELQQKAKLEVNEDPDTRQKKLDQLRHLFKSRPDILFRNDDAFLLRFLRNKKFDVQKAFKKIVHYYEVRRDYTDLFGTFKPLDYKYIFDAEMEMVCPGRDSDGRKVIIARNSRWDVDRYDVAEGFRGSLMMMETILQEEETQINGVVLIADYEGYTMKHFTKSKPSIMKKMSDIYENALPLRIKAVHFVRQPEIFSKLYSIIKSFMSEKLTKRLYFHGEEYGSLHKYVPSSMLPADLGGQLPEFQNKEWRERLLASNEEFEINNKYGFPKAVGSLGVADVGEEPGAGIAGSFKRLEV
ncbi:alpha-tocopherol transfer protein-like [Ptychodera flava]|uniref:alpha-tocopherol transfer protein-like n=1 Tax=Ptychodera flava TaxID=63121 RepID=UPI00396A62F4